MLVGIVGTGIAVYQLAVIKESKKRKQEIQYILAGIGNLALLKNQTWNNQINSFPKFQDNKDIEAYRVHLRARDDLREINGLVTALEGTIDSESSASLAMMEKVLKQGEINLKINELQGKTNNQQNSGANETQ